MIGWDEFKEVVERCAGLGALVGAVLGSLYWLVCRWLQSIWK